MQLVSEPVQRVEGTERYLVPQSVLVRAVAYFIDAFTTALITLAVVYALGINMDRIINAGLLSWPQIAIVAGQCFYMFLWEGAVGWTPGKRVFHLRVTRLDGSRCGWVPALVRNIVLPADLFFVGMIGAVSIAAGFKRQRLGDRMAGTLVVRELPLAMVPPPYVPADKPSRRCSRCGALSDKKLSECPVCGLDLDNAPPWPFGGTEQGAAGARGGAAAGGSRAPGGGRFPGGAAGRATQSAAAADAAATAPADASGRQSSVPSIGLYEEDEDTRLLTAREILLEGDHEGLKELAAVVGGWPESDREFVIAVARTLESWRPIIVLEALRNDTDAKVAESAREAIATVNERNEREAAEIAAAYGDQDEDDTDDEDAYEGEGGRGEREGDAEDDEADADADAEEAGPASVDDAGPDEDPTDGSHEPKKPKKPRNKRGA